MRGNCTRIRFFYMFRGGPCRSLTVFGVRSSRGRRTRFRPGSWARNVYKGQNVTLAIAAAVILSAMTVWGGVIFHLVITKAIYWPVVLFAGAGAIAGGILAKNLVLYFSAKNLKLFFAGWIFILGFTSLPF